MSQGSRQQTEVFLLRCLCYLLFKLVKTYVPMCLGTFTK